MPFLMAYVCTVLYCRVIVVTTTTDLPCTCSVPLLHTQIYLHSTNSVVVYFVRVARELLLGIYVCR